MAKIKIRRSLFIGLGGTGMRTLLYLKKLFIETYGEVPPMIGFLGVDTDEGEYSKSLELKNRNSMGVVTSENIQLVVGGRGDSSETVALTPSEQVQIFVERPKEMFSVQRSSFDWLPKSNIYSLKSLTHGAGQIRSNGRFALVANSQVIEDRITKSLNSIANVNMVDNDKYDIIDRKTDVYLIFSMGGGTGCGTFIDMAYIIRRCDSTCKLAGYAVLPEIFRAQMSIGVDRVRPNGYGAMKDLDWLMSNDWDSKEIEFPLQDGMVWKTNSSPFDAVLFVDNKNRNNDVYNETKQLEEMMALSLVTAVGELSVSGVSVLDNISASVTGTGGSYDVKGKKAWASGLGICEVIIRSNELQKIYAHHATITLVNRLINRPADVTAKVMQWIDSPEIKIREHDADDVIDALLKKECQQMPELDKEDYLNAYQVAQNYILFQKPKDEDVDKALQTLKARVSEGLRNLVVSTLNGSQGEGVGAAEEILKGIESQVNVYLKEMTFELSGFKEKQPQCETALESVAKELSDEAASSWPFFNGKKKEELAQDVRMRAHDLAVLNRELIRRSEAISFFNDLLANIKSHMDNVNEIKNKLHIIADSSRNEIARIHSELSNMTETFQYDLTSRIEESVVANENDILISEFINTLAGNKIYDFSTLETSSIWKSFLQFTYNLQVAKAIGQKDINDVIDSMTEDEFAELVRKIVAKSSPLLPYNFLGHTQKRPGINYYIGVNAFETSRLKKDDYFVKHMVDAGDVNFSKIGMRDRIIVFSQLTPIPPFAIDSLSRAKVEYEERNRNISFHIDASFEEEMKRSGYRLEPGNIDDSMELWVKGIVFGLIKNEDGKYQVKSSILGTRLNGFWKELSEYRDKAYVEFKEISLTIAEEFINHFDSLRAKNGEEYENRLQSAMDVNNYLDKIGQVYMTNKELNVRGNEGIKAIVEQELDELAILVSKL